MFNQKNLFMGTSQSKKAKKSIQAQKIMQFFSYYGYKHGPQIQNWLYIYYSPNFYGCTTLNYGQPKKYQSRPQSLPSVYERAFNGRYRPHDIVFQKVDTKSRTIFYKWINNTPHAVDKSRRIEIPFYSYAIFDQNYRVLQVYHNHIKQLPPVQQPQIQSQRSGYLDGYFDRVDKNMKVVNQLLGQSYVPDTSASDRYYEQSQKRFNQNRRKQAQNYNNWVRQQNNRYY